MIEINVDQWVNLIGKSSFKLWESTFQEEMENFSEIITNTVSCN